MLKKSLCLFIYILLVYSCEEKYPTFIKEGTFKIISNDSTIYYLERLGNYQLKHNRNYKEISRITWVSNNSYSKEILNKKTKFDSLRLVVKIRDIKGKEFYETTFINAVNLKYSSKLLKVKNTVSDNFLKIMKEWEKKENY